MKLLYLCNLVPRKLGAFEDFVVGIGEACESASDEFVCIFAGEPCDKVASSLKMYGVRWHVVSAWAAGGEVHPWAICHPAIKIIRREKPDVVAVHFGNELPSIFIISVLSLLMVGVKRVSWVWHQRQQIADPGTVSRYISRIRLAALFFDHIVVSYLGALRSLRLRGIPEKKVSVIYNSLREADCLEPVNIRESLGIDSEAVVVANVGWLVPRKRNALAIRAFAAANEKYPGEVHLLLVGDGPEAQNLQSLVHELDIVEKVHFLGMRTDVRAILNEVDILLHTSAAETCTNVVQEAMAAACPTVMLEAGAAREQVEDGISGFVVGPDDFDGLCERLFEVVANESMRQRFGVAARKRWNDIFRLDISVEKHCELYRSLVHGEVMRQLPN